MLVGNVLHPGSGLHITAETAGAGAEQAAGWRTPARPTSCSGSSPTRCCPSLTSGEVLQTLLVALLVGFALQAMGRTGEPILRGVGHAQRLVFRVLSMVMWVAPLGAFGAMAAVVGETGSTRSRAWPC